MGFRSSVPPNEAFNYAPIGAGQPKRGFAAGRRLTRRYEALNFLRPLILLLLCISITSCSKLFDHEIEQHEISLNQIFEEVDRFTSNELGDGSFLVFLTEKVGADGWASFAQVSFENGALGVDHVLNIELHQNSAASFYALADLRNLEVQDKTFNGVRYLRIEHTSLTELITEVLIEVHGLSDSDKILVFGELEDAT